MSDINSAISQAQAAAGRIVDAEVVSETLPATAAGPGPVVSYQKPSMDNMGGAAGIASEVDCWLGATFDGMKITDSKGLFDSLLVTIDMTEEQGFFVKQSIKWGDPVTYASSYDGVTSDKGGAWGDQIARVNAIDPKAKVFPSADIILVLAEPLVLKEKTLPVGTKVGLTLAMSNWRNWAEFYREVSKAEMLNQEVTVKVDHDPIEGKNTYKWGVMRFSIAS